MQLIREIPIVVAALFLFSGAGVAKTRPDDFGNVYESITGVNIAGHGSRDMPIWSDEYLHKAQNNAYDTDTWVRIRILALIEYLERLQR
jgi:hypothetical protein